MKHVGLLIITTLLLVSTSYAQNSSDQDDKGIYLGVSLLGVNWNIPDFDLESERGTGIGLKIGYNFNTNLSIFLGVDGSKIDPDEGDDYGLAHFDLGVEGRLGNQSNVVRPFIRSSFTGMAAASDGDDDDVTISGGGFGLGGGVYIFPSPNVSFSLGYTHSWINLSEVEVGSVSVEIDENARSGRLGLGFAYHF